MSRCADFIHASRQFSAGLHLTPGGVFPLLDTPGRFFIRVIRYEAWLILYGFLGICCTQLHLGRRGTVL